MASVLLQHHADLNHRSAQGSDALHLACQLGDETFVFLLLVWGASPNTQNNQVGRSLSFSLSLLLLTRVCCLLL